MLSNNIALYILTLMIKSAVDIFVGQQHFGLAAADSAIDTNNLCCYHSVRATFRQSVTSAGGEK